MKSRPDHHLSIDELLGARAVRALGAMLRTFLVCLPIVLVVMVGTSRPTEIVAVAALLVLVAILYLLYRRRRITAVFHGLLAALVLFGAAIGTAYGSIRSVGMLAFVAAIVVGGIFLGRAALIATVAASALVIGALVVAQNAGWLPAPDYSVGLAQWIVYVVALVAIALNIYYSHMLVIEAMRRAREGEARFRRLFEANPAATVIFTPDEGRIVDCNDAYAALLGRLREAIIGRTGLELGIWRDPADRERARDLLRREGAVRDFPADLLQVDGRTMHCQFSWNDIEIDGSKYILAHVIDLTARKRAEDARRASEARFTKAFQSSPIGMTITRLSDGAYLEANSADEHTLGYTREELLGSSTLRRGAWLDPEGRRRFVALLKEKGRVIGYDTRMRNKAGRLVDCRIYAELIDLEGEPCILASTINVTEQKREELLIGEIAQGVSAETGERFFRRLVEHLARATGADWVMVGELVAEGRRVRTVVRAVDGVQSADVEYGLAGSPCELVLRDGVLRTWLDGVAEAFPQDAALARAGMRSYMGAPLLDADEKPVGVLNFLSRRPLVRAERFEAVLRIFAARAQAELVRLQREREILALNESLEQRVRERTAQLEAANRELESFAYSVSHDLRAPLRAVDGFARIVADEAGGRLDERHRVLLARVMASAARMNQLIEDLLTLSRVSGGQLEVQSVDLGALAGEVCAELRERDPARDVRIDIEQGVRAAGDRRLLRVVLENLLGNAWKFTGKRADARIAFGVESTLDGRPVYVVRDNGAGFDPAYAGKLFAPFQRLHTPQEFEGTGIGLATVQRIIARHGGRIWAESAPGHGATFRFTLGAETALRAASPTAA